ncbi:DUF2063 domain-containing protein [Octadecabacter sp. R77987]|uniref:HvfC/BufC N-terminal domain-containing protein n=1 Tax=Octadecabacter sp. R77987 TaxID=3093874 RepID=UPI00366D52DB
MNVSQSDFRHAVLDPALPTPAGLADGQGRAAGKRFDVYRNNVAVSLSDALETAFPVIRKLVGDDFFRAMAGVYLRAHPPTSPLMMFYGEQMPAFLAGFAPAASLPYLPDMAHLELALRHAYHAPDATPIAADALAQFPPEALGDLRFSLAPALRLVASPYPVHGLWRANMAGEAQTKGGETVLITRPDLDPQMHVVPPASARFVVALQSDATLAGAADEAGDALDLGAILGLLLQQRAITEIKP